MKVLKSIFLSFLFVATSVAAQETGMSPIKSGDKAVYSFITYDQRGREVVEGVTVSVSAEFEIKDDITVIKFANGRVDRFDKDMNMIGYISPARYNVGEIFRWKPADLAPGKKGSVGASFSSATCGAARVDYRDVTLKQAVRKILIKGKETEVPVVEIFFDGRWIAGSCGSGKDQQEIVYAPMLGQILESRLLNYLPSGFLNTGTAVKLVSLD